MNTNIYNEKFHENRELITAKAAEKILSIISNVVNVTSIVDVGCGIGVWINRALEIWNLKEYIGMDGDYIRKDMLLISPDHFITTDLRKEIKSSFLTKKYDLAICLEVAEHLPFSRGSSFVKELTKMSDLILFSAAIVGQPGDGHINNQFLSYWANEFENCGYQAFDLVRPMIQDDKDIPHWYRNNILVYVNKKSPLFEKIKVMIIPPLLHAASEELYIKYYESSRLNESRLSVYEKWVELICSGKNFKDILKNYDSIAIYGIGYFGKKILKELEYENISVKFLIDQNVKEYMDYDVFNPNAKLPSVDLIIISNCIDVDGIKKSIKIDNSTKLKSINELLNEIQ